MWSQALETIHSAGYSCPKVCVLKLSAGSVADRSKRDTGELSWPIFLWPQALSYQLRGTHTPVSWAGCMDFVLSPALLRVGTSQRPGWAHGGCKIWGLTACSSWAPKHNWRAKLAMRREKKSWLCMVSEAFCVITISLSDRLLSSFFLLCIFIHLPIFFLFLYQKKKVNVCSVSSNPTAYLSTQTKAKWVPEFFVVFKKERLQKFLGFFKNSFHSYQPTQKSFFGNIEEDISLKFLTLLECFQMRKWKKVHH